MTREEAFKRMKAYLVSYVPIDFSNQIDEICEALKQEPCDDCISRQAALDMCDRFDGYVPYSVLSHYEMLPSVTPQQKIEQWIPVSEETLPEEGSAVLVWVPERKSTFCAYLEEKQWWIFGAYFQKLPFEVTAWMPPPEPYEKVK